MAEASPLNLVTPDLLAQIQQLLRWQQNFTITGDGVTTDRRPDGFSARIAVPRPPPAKLPTPTRSGVMVKIDSLISSAGGQYNGHIYDLGTNTADGAGDIALPEGYTVDDDVLVLNADEQGTDQQRLDPNTYAAGILLPGVSTEATPRPIVLIPRGECTPGEAADVGSSDIDPGSTQAQQFTDAAKTYSTGRTATTTATLYAVAFTMQVLTQITNTAGVIKVTRRTLAFDADGRLACISEGQVGTV